jgi:hypothetical protein
MSKSFLLLFCKKEDSSFLKKSSKRLLPMVLSGAAACHCAR